MAQNLSDDILYAIFLQALPSEFYLSTLRPPRKPWMVPPFTFSLVSRSWRTLVLSRPTLWSRISVKSRSESENDDSDPGDPIIYHILNRWLSLSSHAPLWIQMDLSEELETVHETILSIFVKEYLRWSVARINIEYWRYPTSPEPPTFPLQGFSPITSLSLRLFGSYYLTVFVDLSSFINDHFSRLEYLSITAGATVRLPADRNALRLPRLRSLIYESREGANLDDVRCILSASPHLELLNLKIWGKSISTSTPDRGSLRLPYLTSLSLTAFTQLAASYVIWKIIRF
ncbi:hypothetical protein SCHPADRAFT_728409 [Schizopora paradoxa]|uniref:F-box domain-containing protein n=1 Tax=Schizopora paradoxa TaxID=27342 RepID=A0A0H2R0Y1_9AGAM|nr:hypothetical protein SCHPADRAFT_728409 [Schizopora paradoxa]